jgi:ketosteroid isomerase-like protein
MKGLILAFALFFPSAAAPPPSNQELIGYWRLVRFTRTIVATGQTFETFGERPSGFIEFGNDGRMTMLIVKDQRPNPPDPEKMTARFARYVNDGLSVIVFINLGQDAEDAMPALMTDNVAAIYISALVKGNGQPPPAPAAQEANQSRKFNQRAAPRLSSQQKDVWKGEQNYFRYLQAKDLQGFMSLWDDNFLGWPDYSEVPLRKRDIESGVSAEFQNVQQAARPLPAPKPEAIGVFGNVAVTHYFWPEADDMSTVKYRITHTWRKGPDGWRIISGMDCAVPRSSEATR